MTQMLVLTEPDLRSIVRLDASAVACVEDAFAALATKPVVMPPILRLDLAEHRNGTPHAFSQLLTGEVALIALLTEPFAKCVHVRLWGSNCHTFCNTAVLPAPRHFDIYCKQ